LNKAGFLCFMLLLAFASLQVRFSSQRNALNELAASEAIALEAEKVNFLRTLLEENSDFIVKEILGKEIASCNAREAKQRINRALLNYFGEMQKSCRGISIKFNSSNGETPDPGFMDRNSAVIAKKIGKSCMLLYIFHGGIMRNGFIRAEISGKRFSQEFLLPAGYSQQLGGIAIE
jgi:hypothetical protein